MTPIMKSQPARDLKKDGMPKIIHKPRMKALGLYGTEKQITWALDIRQKFLIEIDAIKKLGLKELNGYRKLNSKELNVLDIIEENINYMDDAEWFINNRHFSVAYWIKHTIEERLVWNRKKIQ